MTKPSNPKRSGGPKTKEGKEIAATNSLKTGTFSSMVVLPGEDRAEFEALQQHFFEDFRPRGVVEEAMVYELSTIVWKKLRLEKIESTRFEDLLNKNPNQKELIEVGFFISDSASWVLKDLTELNSLNLQRYQQDLRFLNDLDQRAPIAEDIEQLETNFPEAYGELVRLAISQTGGDLDPKILCLVKISQNNGPQVFLTKYVIEDEIRYANEMVRLIERRSDLEMAINRAKTNRMLQVVQRADLNNARNHLDARFYKLLAELRKQKDWHNKNQVIDVTPEKSEGGAQ